MRITGMLRFLLASSLVLSSLPLAAQITLPANSRETTHFKDTSVLKPPAGTKIAIIEFEDLECAACRQAAPIVRAAMAKYGIPRVHHDYLIPSHVWSPMAAIDARYLEDRVSKDAAETYRMDVFANQPRIASRDDLQRYTASWFKAHALPLPFTFDATGQCAKEVSADCLLAARIGVWHTPTIVVATANRWIEVADPLQLDAAIDMAKASLIAPRKITR